MPLIIISGYPSAGKTRRAEQLAAEFRARIAADPATAARLSVALVNDESLGIARSAYAGAAAEKNARAAHAAAVQRALGRDVIAIADALNYIKGVRYQLHCEAKAAGTPSCVVHVGTPVATCRAINDAVRAGRAPTVVRGEVVPADAGDAARPEGAAGAASAEADAPPTAAERAHGDAPGADAAAAPEDGAGGGYDPELFDNLVYRYEEPDGRARWDRPLFTVLADDPAPPYDAIWDALVVRPGGGRAKAVRPNQATVLAPAAAPDALHELDRSTAAVAAALGAHLAEHPGESGGAVAVPGAAEAVRLPAGARPVTAPQVQRLRREFVALWRGHGAGIAAARAADGFVRFLNAKWEAE